MTRNLPRNAVLCLWIFLSPLLSSCSWLKGEQTQRLTDADGQAQMELEAGRFQRAIDIYEEFRQKYPQDSAAQSGYVRMLESIKSSGDRAFERNDFETAQNIYEILARNWPRFADLGPSLSFNKSFLGKKAKASACLFVRGQVASYLKAGEFQRAINLSKDTYQKYPRNPGVRSDYIQTLERIKINGDRAFEKGDFALAGSVYELLLKHVPSVARLNGSSPLNKEDLSAKIKTCVKSLFESGLRQYRFGNLDQAISIWKGILAFDPGNEEVKRVVDRAALQLKNLQKTK
ncbi:MAG: tetratricopeptide repeat protein [bacterium]